MELIITIISLMWVIGILTLQRLDVITDDFSKALAYYLSLESNGSIDQTQLSVKSLLPKTAVVEMTKALVVSSARKDKDGLKKAIRFFNQAATVRFSLELTLVTATVLMPLIYLINFSRLGLLTFMDKDAVTYSFLFVTTLMAIIFERLLTHISDKYYPLSVSVGK